VTLTTLLPAFPRSGLVLVTVVRDSFPDNHARIIDGLCYRESLEIALRKIAKCVQVKHLAIHEEDACSELSLVVEEPTIIPAAFGPCPPTLKAVLADPPKVPKFVTE
jgi:hypothetical protein